MEFFFLFKCNKKEIKGKRVMSLDKSLSKVLNIKKTGAFIY